MNDSLTIVIWMLVNVNAKDDIGHSVQNIDKVGSEAKVFLVNDF